MKNLQVCKQLNFNPIFFKLEPVSNSTFRVRSESPIESPIPGDRVIGSEGELLSSCSCTDVTLDENNQINHHHSRRKRRVVRRHVVSESENDQPQPQQQQQQQQQQLHHRVKIMNQPELNNSSQITKGTKVN
jgi:hypothetical protein